MNKLLYVSDDDVQSQLATKYNLLVHIGLETFQYAIIVNGRSQVKVLAEFEIPAGTCTGDLIKLIEQLPESARQFRFSFNSVKISYHTTNYTFIPADLYLHTNQMEYGKYINQKAPGDLLVNSIQSAEIKSISSIDLELHAALNKIFPRPKIFNHASPFLEGIQRDLKREDELVIYLDIQPMHFQAAFFKDYKLEFHNTFEFATVDEFNYYLLNMIVSLEIPPDKTPVYLSGKISQDDKIYERIEKYFENIQFISSGELTKYPAESADINSHTFFSLFSLDLCV